MHITGSDFTDQAKSAEIICVYDRQQDVHCPASVSSTADEYMETDAEFPVPVCHFLLPHTTSRTRCIPLLFIMFLSDIT